MLNGKFEVGDIVYLKSGSPKMTVTDVSDTTQKVMVAWVIFHTSEMRVAAVSPGALKLACMGSEYNG